MPLFQLAEQLLPPIGQITTNGRYLQEIASLQWALIAVSEMYAQWHIHFLHTSGDGDRIHIGLGFGTLAIRKFMVTIMPKSDHTHVAVVPIYEDKCHNDFVRQHPCPAGCTHPTPQGHLFHIPTTTRVEDLAYSIYSVCN